MISFNTIYKLLLLEAECVKIRATCNHNCSSCSYSADPLKLQQALYKSIELVKAKDPTLYFIDNITELKEAIQDARNKSEET